MPPVTTNRVRIAVVALGAVATMLAASISATPNAGADGIGPSDEYSFGGSDCKGSSETDPVGVLFRGKRASAHNVASQIKLHTGWDYEANKSQYARVHLGNDKYECRYADESLASAPEYEFNVPPVSERFHTRLWLVPASNGTGDLKTVGTPHHEDWVWYNPVNNDCKLIPGVFNIGNHAVDEGGVNQGKDSGFDQGRHRLREQFEQYGHATQSEVWGNTREFDQCDGDKAGSDGYGVNIWVNHAMTAEASQASSSTTLKGRLTTQEATTEWWFGYGPYSSQGVSGYPNKTTVRMVQGTAEMDVSETISAQGCAYYLRMFARNQDGEIEEGPEILRASAPIAETKPAGNVSEFEAGLNGAVNPNCSATTYHFEYGTTAAYGESVPVPDGNAGSGTSAVSVGSTASRLEPGTTYHYRLVASNAGGTSYGSDLSFHTPGWRFMRGLSSGTGVSSWSTAIGMDLPPMAVGDINGDGKADVVSVEKDNGLYRYKFGYSDGSGIPNWNQVLSGMGRPTRLAVGDLTGDGKADIVAVEPDGSGSYRYMLGYGNGSNISSWSQILGGMGYPTKLGLGDLTGDGKADIVAVESHGNGQYRYMLGTSSGSGISSWSQILANMAYAEFLDLGDFNADGKADVVSVENQGNGQFRFMLGTSSGAGIGSWGQVMGNMAGPYFFNVGDFNADGKADMVSVEADGGGKYRYMLGTSNGAGIGSWGQVLSGMGLPTRSDLGDLTGDGKADVVSVETESTGSYNYRLGISSGSGVSAWNQLVSWMRTPRVTGVGDVNADGKADIVSVESEGGGKYRYQFGFSNAVGIVSNWRTVLTGMGLPNTIKVGDLTGDGKADIVAVEPQGNGQYRYMLGKSSGTGVSSWGSILSGMGLPTRMNLGDFSGDGKADIVAFEPEGSGKYRIMRGLSSGSGISSWSQVLGGLSYPQKAAVGDLTGDGKADVVSVESHGNGQYRYMLGTSSGSGISSWSQILANMAYAEFLDLGDFNADGKADVVSVENQGNGQFRFMLGTSSGAGIGSWGQVMGNMAGPYFFHLGDLNGDGKADIVSAEAM